MKVRAVRLVRAVGAQRDIFLVWLVFLVLSLLEVGEGEERSSLVVITMLWEGSVIGRLLYLYQ